MKFGVDEAGKGPVLGSMFAAAVLADPADLPDDVADSKRLSSDRRESIANSLAADPAVQIGVTEIPVTRIDDPETDMNTLAVEAHASAIESVASDGHEGIVDACDTNAARFGRRVADRVSANVSIQADHSADDEYLIVSAASVVAKVARDRHVEGLAEGYDEPLGSGYPSDPTTRSFLESYVRENGSLPPCARRTWKTSEEVLATVEQASFEEF